MKPRLRLTRQESHDATRARIIEEAERVFLRIYNLRGWFWILVTIALIALHILANLSKVSHPQP